MDAASCCRVSARRTHFSLAFYQIAQLTDSCCFPYSVAGLLHAAMPPPASQAGGAAAAVLYRVGRARCPSDLEAAVQGTRHGGEEGRGG